MGPFQSEKINKKTISALSLFNDQIALIKKTIKRINELIFVIGFIFHVFVFDYLLLGVKVLYDLSQLGLELPHVLEGRGLQGSLFVNLNKQKVKIVCNI